MLCHIVDGQPCFIRRSARQSKDRQWNLQDLNQAATCPATVSNRACCLHEKRHWKNSTIVFLCLLHAQCPKNSNSKAPSIHSIPSSESERGGASFDPEPRTSLGKNQKTRHSAKRLCEPLSSAPAPRIRELAAGCACSSPKSRSWATRGSGGGRLWTS